ncbi:hypothetical protein PMAYCL1PPCAC_03874, partial [Pristionchus mayeri]
MPSSCIVGSWVQSGTAGDEWEVKEALAIGRDSIGDYLRPEFEYLRDTVRPTLRIGHVRAASHFDHDYFGMSEAEALAMDPQIRRALQGTIYALESAGITLAEARALQPQVYSSCWCVEYPDLLEGTEQFRVTGNSASMIVGRVAHMLDSRGASMVVDTGCASGLAASHLARLAIEKGETQLAIIVTTNLIGWKSTASMLKINMLSQSGFSHTFDRDACGFLRADAFGVLVYASDELARAKGWRIRATLAATHMNSDGATRNITSPCVQAQVEMYDSLLAGRDRASIDCVIAHGTGTKVGDRVELSSINQLFPRPLPVYSCKSLFGHGESTSSLLATISAVQCLETGRLPSQLHLSMPREETGDKHLTFIREERPLNTIALSAFSYGGSNVAGLLQRPTVSPAPSSSAVGERTWMVAFISAKTPAALAQRQVDLADFLDQSSSSLSDILHTLDARRTFYPLRRAVVGRTRADFARALRAGLTLQARDGAGPALRFRMGSAGALWRYRVLYEGCGVFRRAFDEICEQAKHVYEPERLKKCLFSPFDDVIDEAASALMLTLALVKMWEAFGALPSSLTPTSKIGLLAALVINRLVKHIFYSMAYKNAKMTIDYFEVKKTIPLVAEDEITFFESTDDVISSFTGKEENQLVSFGGIIEDEEFTSEIRRTELLLGEMFVRGVDVTVNARSGKICDLPLYPFTPTEFWPEPKNLNPTAIAASAQIPIAEKIVDVNVEAKIREIVAKFALDLNDDDTIPEVLDSLSAMDLTASLGESFDLTLPLDTTDKHSTIPELVAYISSKLRAEPKKGVKAGAGPGTSSGAGTKLAVLGFDLVAADAAGVEELHDKLLSGRRSASYNMHGVEEFDAEYFGIGKEEAEFMDPQHRLLLHSSIRAWQEAGCPDLENADLLLAISSTSDHRANIERECDKFDENFWQGTNHSVFSGLAAKVLGVGGRSAVIDTTCTSVYSALELAQERIGSGAVSHVVILAAKLHLSDSWHESLATFLAGGGGASGRAAPFSAAADGYVRADCVGALVVGREGAPGAPLAIIDAVRTRQSGSGVMPSEAALAQLIDHDVDVVIAHGTGTLTGDRIEAAAYVAQKTVPRLLASIKGIVGHAEAASGLPHLAAAIGMLRSGRVPAHQNVDLLMEQLRTADHVSVPFVPEEHPSLTRVGLVSYGVAGVHGYACVSLPPKAPKKLYSVPVVLPISAHSEEALQKNIDHVREMITNTSAPLAEIAAQLQAHDPARCRAAAVAATHAEAAAALAAPTRTTQSLFVAHCMPEDIDVVGFSRGCPEFRKRYVEMMTAIGGNLTTYDIRSSVAGMASLFRLFLRIDTIHSVCVTESGALAALLALDLAPASTIRHLIRAYDRADARALLIAARDVDFGRTHYKLVDAAGNVVRDPAALEAACRTPGIDVNADILVGGRGFRGGRAIASIRDLAALFAQMFVNGAELNWSLLGCTRSGARVRVPAYAFTPSRFVRFLQRANIDVRTKRYAYLADHVIQQGMILPGAYSVARMLERLELRALAMIDFIASAYVEQSVTYLIDKKDDFHVAQAAGVEIIQAKEPDRAIRIRKISKAATPKRFMKPEIYEKMSKQGYMFKPHFKSLNWLEIDVNGVGRARLERRTELDVQLDAVFQGVIVGHLCAHPDDDAVYLPFYCEQIRVDRETMKKAGPMDVRFRIHRSARSIHGDVLAFMAGRLVVEIQNFVMARRDAATYIPPAVTPITTSAPVIRVMALRKIITCITFSVEEDHVDSGKRMPLEQADLLLREWIMATLETDELDDELGFFEMGLASHQVTYLRNYLRSYFPSVSPTAAFDYPTIPAMAEYLATLECVKGKESLDDEVVSPIREQRISSAAAEQILRGKILSMLKIEEIDEELGFLEMGLESKQLLLLRNQLRELFPDLSPVAAFDYPTIPIMAKHLATLEYIAGEEDDAVRVMMIRVEMEEESDEEEDKEFATITPQEAQELLRRWIKKELKMDELDEELGFIEMGLQSHKLIHMRNYLRALFPSVSPVAAFDHPTIEKLGIYLSKIEWIGSEEDLQEVRVMVVRVEEQPVSDPSTITLGVISSACRLPGGCKDLAEYWDLLKTGRDSVSRIPATRIATRDVLIKGAKYGNKVEGGHYIDGVTEFDPAFFKISKNEANAMDPQQRLILEVVAECLENSGIPKEEYSTLGVFVGLMAMEYTDAVESPPTNVVAMLGSAICVMSGRISYWLGTHGPTLTVDTACSSSLVAVNEARAALAAGTCTKAIVAAANVNIAERPMGMRVNGRMLCYDGTCKAFDARANGYGRSEGVAAILIETARSDASYSALIPAVNVNHGGRGVSLMAPNGVAQNLLIDRVLRDSPSTVPSYWEAHGTGTALGDPIEINVLARLLGTAVIGSNKASIGHGEAVAGLNGVLKVLVQSKHSYIPNTLHMHCLNPDIDPKKVGFPIIGHEWQDERAMAGVSSFGVSGTNSAVLMCRDPKAQRSKMSAKIHRAYAIPVTAKNARSLEMATEQMEEFLRETSYNLAEVASTAALKREHYAQQRTVLIVDCKGAVIKKLTKIQAKPQPLTVCIGSASIGSETLQLMALPAFAEAFSRTRKELDITGASLFALVSLLKQTLPAATLTAADNHGRGVLDLMERKITVDKAAGALRGSAGPASQAPAAFHSLQDFYELSVQAFADGHNLDWNALYLPTSKQLILPTYAFNHSTHWLGKRFEEGVFEDEHLGVRSVEGEQTRFDNNLSQHRHRDLFRLDETTLALYLIQKSIRLSAAEAKSFAISVFNTTDVEVEDNVWMKAEVDTRAGNVTLYYAEKEAARARFSLAPAQAQSVQLPTAAAAAPLHLPFLPTAHLVGDVARIGIADALLNDPLLPTVAVVKHLSEKLDETSTITFFYSPDVSSAYPISVASDNKRGVVQAHNERGAVVIELSGGVNIIKQEKKVAIVAATVRDKPDAASNSNISSPILSNGSDAVNDTIKRMLGDILTNDDLLTEEELAGGFTEMGLDSLSMMDFVNALNAEYADLEMSSTDLYDNPTVDELVAFIVGKVGEGVVEVPQVAEHLQERPERKKEAAGHLDSLKEQIKTILEGILTSDEPLDDEELEGGFTEMGLDSLSMMDFVNALNGHFIDLALTSTDLFDHPTISELTTLINERLGGSTMANDQEHVESVPMENGIAAPAAAEGHHDIKNKVIEILGGILTTDDPLEPEELEGGFTEMGLDSLSMMDFVNALNGEFAGLELTSTDLYDHPTVAELAALIVARTGGSVASIPEPVPTDAGSVANTSSGPLPDAFVISEGVGGKFDADFEMIIIDAGKVAFKRGSEVVGDIGDSATVRIDLDDVLTDAELFSQFLVFAKAVVKKKGPFTFAVSKRETRANATARAFFKTIASEKFPKVRYHWTERFHPLPLTSSPLSLPPTAVFLITGGLSGIGLAVAEYIVSSSSIKAMILVSRRQPDAETQKKIDEMRKRTDVIVLSTDIAKPEALRTSLSKVPHKITHVIHSAGVLKDAMLIRQTPALFEAVYAPKVAGLETLERTLLSLSHPLSHVIAMSSIAAVLGNTGQANYSVCNRLLDHWARSGTPTHARTAINWGNWREIGMAVAVQDQLDAMGLEGLKPEDGVRYVGHVLNERHVQLTVSKMDWNSVVAFRKDLPADILRPQQQLQNQDFPERPEAKARDKSQYEELHHIEIEQLHSTLRPSGILIEQARLAEVREELARSRSAYADLVMKYLPDRGAAAVYLSGDDVASASAAKAEPLDQRAPSKLAMLFPGQGAQYPLMAAQLSRVFPGFREAFNACVRAADAAAGCKPTLREIADDPELYLEQQRTSVSQILVFAHSYACFELWKSLGVKPDFLIGHSIGELVAVAASGILSLEDAAAVVLKRGEAMELCKGRGAMMALDRAHLDATLKRFPALYLAADNTIKQAVVAGDRLTIDTALAHLKSQRVTAAVINEQYPFHTPLITEEDLAEYAAVLEKVTLREGAIPIVRNVDGELTTTYSKEYLIAQARSAVLFVPSVATLVSEVEFEHFSAGHAIDFDRAYPRLSSYSLRNGLRLRNKLNEREIEVINDHKVRGVPTVPGTLQIHKMHEVLNGINDGKCAVIRDGAFRSIWQTTSPDYVINRSPSGAFSISVAGIRVSVAQAALLESPPSPACPPQDLGVEQDVAAFYRATTAFGIYYGRKFAGTRRLFFTDRRSQAIL